MFTFQGRGKSVTCNGQSRRDFLQVGTLGALGLSLPHLFAAQAQGAVKPDHDDRNCIMIFNLGAPSQLDLWDMKPDAPAEVRGPFKPIATTNPDLQLSEILPNHAKIADKFSLVRSVHHTGAAVHDAGWQMMQTGRLFSGGVNTPHIGSVVSFERGRKTDLPAFAVLPQLMGRGGGNMPNGQAGGFLGKAHDPFALNADPSKENFKVPDLLPPIEIDSSRLERRRRIRDLVDQAAATFEASESADLLGSNFESAFRLMTSPKAREAFDLTKEPQKVRERYGMNRFGQCCLLSRRLIENGVRFVTINTFLTVFDEITWDIHGSKPFTSIEGMKNIVAPLYDQGYSALVEDLDQRGLLDSTLVCNLAEFGRTPRVNPAGGRDHWPQCFTCGFAGGGVQGGRIVGASDPIGAVPADRPVQPADVAATIFHSLGFDMHKTLPGPGGRPFPIVDSGHNPIHELFQNIFLPEHSMNMRLQLTQAAVVLAALIAGMHSPAMAEDSSLVILPRQIELRTPQDRQLAIVQQKAGEQLLGQAIDAIEWTSADPKIATVEGGIVRPAANGTTTITAKAGDKTASVEVTVSGQDQPTQYGFRSDVLPILSKRDCNAGGCHGALAGKGGFRLSLNGYDPESDYFNIVKQDKGRRIEFAAPEYSLLLNKPSTAVPHKGGLKLERDSEDFHVLADWIAHGAIPPEPGDPETERLEVFPDASLQTVGSTQQFSVRAHYSDGTSRDVTRWVRWSSTNDTVSQVNDEGLATIMGPGEGAIVAWYDSKLAIARTTVPYSLEGNKADVVGADDRKPRNFIDEHIDAQLDRLNLVASPNCSDAEFLRRAYVDTIGRIPTLEETRDYLADTSKDKRDKLIEKLLESPEFVDYWSYKWSDVLMLNGTLLRPTALKTYYQWIHGHVEKNTPWDQMVREIVTSTGESTENGATNFFALNQTPEEMTENASQAFMSLSIGCAKCHNHPLEKWTNDQYYAMANIFSRVKAKGWGGEGRNGDGARTLYVATSGELVQPRTGKPQPPTPLDGEAMAFDSPEDRRIKFAHWLTSPDNPYFAKAITNRVWANFYGVGLVEEVDDLRISNPPSNGELFDAATKHVVDSKFDLKLLMRTILQSNAYQRSSKPIAGNEAESRFYSRYYPRRIMAEVLHDAVVQVTGVPSKFDTVAFPGNDKQKTDFYPEGTKAIQLYDSAVENYFLSTFGRNPRNIVCECERSSEPTMVQVLHISNGNTINNKLQSKDSRVEKLLQLRRSGLSDEALVDEIYLTCFSRYPTSEKRKQLVQFLPPVNSDEERATIEDLFWGLLSTREFLFNH